MKSCQEVNTVGIMILGDSANQYMLCLIYQNTIYYPYNTRVYIYTVICENSRNNYVSYARLC